jgi:hypothetical protein
MVSWGCYWFAFISDHSCSFEASKVVLSLLVGYEENYFVNSTEEFRPTLNVYWEVVSASPEKDPFPCFNLEEVSFRFDPVSETLTDYRSLTVEVYRGSFCYQLLIYCQHFVVHVEFNFVHKLLFFFSFGFVFDLMDKKGKNYLLGQDFGVFKHFLISFVAFNLLQ